MYIHPEANVRADLTGDYIGTASQCARLAPGFEGLISITEYLVNPLRMQERSLGNLTLPLSAPCGNRTLESGKIRSSFPGSEPGTRSGSGWLLASGTLALSNRALPVLVELKEKSVLIFSSWSDYK